MAFCIFLSLAGMSYCVFMNSPRHIRRTEYAAIGTTVLLAAISAAGDAYGITASPLLLLGAIPLWLKLDRAYALQREDARAAEATSVRVEPRIEATIHPFPEHKIPLRTQLLGTTSSEPDYELAPIDHFCYAKRRI